MRNSLGAARRAAVNKGLLIVLLVMVVAAAGFWFWKYSSEPKLSTAPRSDRPPAMYKLACELEGGCHAVTEHSRADLKAISQDEDGHYRCPKCGKFTAMVYRPGSIVVPMSDK